MNGGARDARAFDLCMGKANAVAGRRVTIRAVAIEEHGKCCSGPLAAVARVTGETFNISSKGE